MAHGSMWNAIFSSSKLRTKRLKTWRDVLALDAEKPPRRWGGSVPGRRVIRRDRVAARLEIMRNYFDEHPLFDAATFRRRFRMNIRLFRRIVREIEAKNPYFQYKPNAVGAMGFDCMHKSVVAMRMLAYGCPADSLDEKFCMAESTILETVKEFADTIIQLYEAEYLRPPNAAELQSILAENEARGFPGMIGSIDCMHWEWSACPTAYHGIYRGHKGKPTVILEAVASKDLRIWHAFFGLPGSHNDINVLHRSPVFDDLANGRAPTVQFMVNGQQYTMGYYLADKIYPDWSTLVKTISEPRNLKDSNFAKAQEAARKDVERTFGVLRSKFRIIQTPSKFWSPQDINAIMYACIILHNMIVEDEREMPTDVREFEEATDPPVNTNREVPPIEELMQAYRKITDRGTSNSLQQALVEHHWNLHGLRQGPCANHR